MERKKGEIKKNCQKKGKEKKLDIPVISMLMFENNPAGELPCLIRLELLP